MVLFLRQQLSTLLAVSQFLEHARGVESSSWLHVQAQQGRHSPVRIPWERVDGGGGREGGGRGGGRGEGRRGRGRSMMYFSTVSAFNSKNILLNVRVQFFGFSSHYVFVFVFSSFC